MDYLHYRLKNWKPLEYIELPAGKKRIARAYMRQEIRERNETYEEIDRILSGESYG